jgi:hypothetical protein
MKGAFDLSSYDDVAHNSEAVVGRLRDGSPCDGAWSPEQVAVFQRWIDAEMPLSMARPEAPHRGTIRRDRLLGLFDRRYRDLRGEDNPYRSEAPA